MGIRPIKEVVCDNCGVAIDYFDKSIPNSEIKRIVEASGGVVEKYNLTFCSDECMKEYKEK